jgi:hypothetical protein
VLAPLALAAFVGAPAPSPSVGFEWDAPADCPSAEDVEALVAERVGAPLREGEGDRLDVIARVRRADDGRFTMRVWIIDATGTHRRDVDDADCALLAEAAATMVAVFVQPEPSPEPEPEPKPEPERAPEPKPEPERDPPASPPRDATPRGPGLAGDLRALGVFDLGTLPGPAGGFGVAGNLDIGRARLELHGRATFAGELAIPGGTAATQLWSASMRGGFVPRWGKIELALMAGIDVGALSARAAGVPAARGGNVAWAAIVASPGLVFRPHPRLGLWAAVDGYVALLRPRIVLDDGSRVHQPAPGGFRASAGIGVRFGVTDRAGSRQPSRRAEPR